MGKVALPMKKGTMTKLYVPWLLQDPFHNNMTLGEVTLELPCMGGRKGRDGLFPASDCIKVTGYYGKGQTFSLCSVLCVQHSNISMFVSR